MTNSNILDRLAVCSWSLQPTSPDQLVSQILDIGIPRVQIALDPLRENPGLWGSLPQKFQASGIQFVSGMFGTLGEDYTTMESIKRTGGVVPDAVWPDNWKNIQADAELAAKLGIKLVTFHAGFLPHEESDPDFAKLLNRIAQIAELFAKYGIDLGFETGQETADTLSLFLKKLNAPNVGVNFDPANMILYAKGNPIEALRTLGPWLKQCHIKDALQTRVPGTWGEEVTAGTGQVDWTAFFRTLRDLGYKGYCSIEREAGNQRVADIKAGRAFLEKLLY